MHLLVYGPGRLGTAIGLAARDAGWTATVLGRPVGGARPPAPLADVVVDASRGDAVAAALMQLGDVIASLPRDALLAGKLP